MLSATTVAASATAAHAQQIPDLSGALDSSLFSQELTDAVTQGFRQRDRVFFEEGVVQFEQVIRDLQEGEQPDPILTIESISDDWQQFETLSDMD